MQFKSSKAIGYMDVGKKYRFLFVIEMTGGNATYFQNLKDVISVRDDICSTWLPIELEPRELIARVPPISMNWTLRGGLVTRARVRALERSGLHFDAAFFHHQVVATFLHEFRRRVPLVISTDATPISYFQYAKWYGSRVAHPGSIAGKFKRAITRSVYKDASFLLPFSTWTKKSLMEDYGIPEEKISVIPPGINLKRWVSGQAPKRKLDSEKNGKRIVRLLFVGGDFLRKGGDLLLEIARREDFQQCEFHLVTRSFSGSLPSNLFVHTGVEINSDRLIGLYREADVFVLPTRADLTPQAICEAMVMGLPVVSTDVGGNADAVIEGETGYLIPVDDKDALADRLKRLVENSELRMHLGLNAKRLAESKFDLEKNAQAIIGCLVKAANANVV
jgi:glycosyltransferase involved in cell wall biosynthesis